MNKSHIGSLIKAEMKRQKMSASELAKKLNVQCQTVYDILQSANIDVEQLIDVSKVLDKDFLQAAFVEVGWNEETQIYKDYQFTLDNYRRVVSGKCVNYLLNNIEHLPLAIVHKYPNLKSQYIGYGKTLDVPFVYCFNGSCIEEHDNITGTERTIAFDEFPTPNDLHKRWIKESKYTEKQMKIIEQPYYYDTVSHVPRYYQRIAINKTLEAIAKGKKRVMFEMATGTGKTFTAFQIIQSLLSARKVKKVLYLAEREDLIEQIMKQDFRPFSRYMTKIPNWNMDSTAGVCMSLFNQMANAKERQLYEEFSPDYFDLIIIDECRRGNNNDAWDLRNILEYFKPAIQIGMTAMSTSQESFDKYKYFGKPVFVYSQEQGVEDGFIGKITKK